MRQTCLAHAARRTANLVTRHYNRFLAPLELEVTQAVLLGVIASGQAQSLSALADLMGIDRSTLQRNLRPLEMAGLVQKVRHGSKRISARLTDIGHSRLNQAYLAWQDAQATLAGALENPSADQVRDNLEALRKAVRRLETAAAQEPADTAAPLY